MENLISWFEIPVNDMARAKKFYSDILGIEITEQDMFGTLMGFFPFDDKSVSGALVKGDDYIPSSNGVLVYLNGGKDLNDILNKVTAAGGNVIMPKTLITEEYGYLGMFIDSEGNKLAVHSNL